jgi:hypothetical protein
MIKAMKKGTFSFLGLCIIGIFCLSPTLTQAQSDAALHNKTQVRIDTLP